MILLVVCQVVVAALLMVVDLRHRRLWSSRCAVGPPDSDASLPGGGPQVVLVDLQTAVVVLHVVLMVL